MPAANLLPPLATVTIVLCSLYALEAADRDLSLQGRRAPLTLVGQALGVGTALALALVYLASVHLLRG